MPAPVVRGRVGSPQAVLLPVDDEDAPVRFHHPMTLQFAIVAALVIVALAFDFINGFHDAANSIATVVSTRVLSPGRAVLWAAGFAFLAAVVFGQAVAHTVGSGLIDVKVVTFGVLFCGLVGAITWDLITWYFGLPTSSSHALIGAYAGAAILKAGFGVIILSGWIKTLVFIVVSPLIGLLSGMLLMSGVYWLVRNQAPGKVDRWFRRLQLVSAGFFSLTYGGNDAQKTMGIIAGVLLTAGYIDHFYIPTWVIVAAYLAICCGTLAGGWRIIHTMGGKITKLQPVSGFAAETGAGFAVALATLFGIPVSTTQAITGAIVGVGSTRRLSAVRWGVAGQILWAWIFTIPAAGTIGALTYGLLSLFGVR